MSVWIQHCKSGNIDEYSRYITIPTNKCNYATSLYRHISFIYSDKGRFSALGIGTSLTVCIHSNINRYIPILHIGTLSTHQYTPIHTNTYNTYSKKYISVHTKTNSCQYMPIHTEICTTIHTNTYHKIRYLYCSKVSSSLLMKKICQSRLGVSSSADR